MIFGGKGRNEGKWEGLREEERGRGISTYAAAEAAGDTGWVFSFLGGVAVDDAGAPEGTAACDKNNQH